MNPNTGEVYTIPEGQPVPENLVEITAEEKGLLELFPTSGQDSYNYRQKVLLIYRECKKAGKGVSFLQTVYTLDPETRKTLIVQLWGQEFYQAKVTPKKPAYIEAQGTQKDRQKKRIARKKLVKRLAKQRRKAGR